GFLNVSKGPFYSRKGQKPQNCAVGFGPSKPMVTGSNPVGIANKSMILRGYFLPVEGVSVCFLPRRHGAGSP
ncbi:hypothetical protein, partial [Mesorhizobium japonicum]|uniref:hypothetical protein n=1 Tax=Mesorhizobium japonicum TaxID=2066070 RepID=UPI001AEDF7EF